MTLTYKQLASIARKRWGPLARVAEHVIRLDMDVRQCEIRVGRLISWVVIIDSREAGAGLRKGAMIHVSAATRREARAIAATALGSPRPEQRRRKAKGR